MIGTESTPFGPDGHPRRWAALAVLVISLIVVVLDNTVLSVALPTIQQDLEAAPSELVWAIDSYVLVFAATLFTWGALGDQYGRKRILLIGLAIFGFASALSARALTPEQLIAYRALMGVGGAAVLPVTSATISVIFPARERPMAIGIWAASIGAGVAMGPVVGSLLLKHPETFAWLGNGFGSVFLINVPLVMVGLVAIALIVPETANPNPGRTSLKALLLTFVGLASVLYGIIEAGDTRTWNSAHVLAPILLGLTLLTIFVLQEARSPEPTFDVSVFRNRPFTVCLSAVSLGFFALNGVIFALPFYLQVVRGLDILAVGWCFLPFALGQIVGAPSSALLAPRIGIKTTILIGFGVICFALATLTFLHTNTELWSVLVLFAMFGYGMGTLIAPASTVIQNALPQDKAGAGSAVQNTVRQVFGALGVAVIGTLAANQYSNALAPTLAKLPSDSDPKALEALDRSVAAVPIVAKRAAEAGVPQNIIDFLTNQAFAAFMSSLSVAIWSALIVIALAAVIIALGLPNGLQFAKATGPGAQHLPPTPTMGLDLAAIARRAAVQRTDGYVRRMAPASPAAPTAVTTVPPTTPAHAAPTFAPAHPQAATPAAPASGPAGAASSAKESASGASGGRTGYRARLPLGS